MDADPELGGPMIHSPQSPAEARPAALDTSADQAKELFEEHVPLSLIMDLNPPAGPNSQEILDAEGIPAEPWWDKS
jgi:hypothetical protein